MTVFVRDPGLYRRLREEVSEGEELSVTTETNWDSLSEGDSLVAFDRLPVTGPAVTAVSA
jgi:hypothetical protein